MTKDLDKQYGVRVAHDCTSYDARRSSYAKTTIYLLLMPELGDTVKLYIPGSRESKAYIRHAVPESKRSVSSGTQHKLWGHPDGPSIGMSSDEMTVQAGAGLIITLNDQGVMMQSAGNISIQGGSLSLKAGQIKATAPEAIWLLGGGSSFILDGQADVRAGLLQQEGSHKAPVVVADLPPEPPLIPLEQYEAAQAANAAEAAAMQPSVVNMKEVSLFGAAVAMAGMIPVLGMLGGAPAIAAQAVVVGAAAIGLIGNIPSVGSFKPSALQLLNHLNGDFVGKMQQQEAYKHQLFGKVVSAARELSTATSFMDFVKKLHQQEKEVSQMYYQIPGNTREHWAHQQVDQELKEALVYYGDVKQNDIKYELFFGPYHNGIARDIGRIDITAEEMGDYNYWQKQNLTVEQKKYLARRIMAPMSEEELSTLMGEFEQHEMTMKGLDGEFNGFTGRVSTKKGSSGVPEPSDHPGTTGSPSAASKGTTTTDKPATSKTKTFVKKSKDVMVKAVSDYYKESQVIRFQPWGNLGKNKPKESGNAGEVGSGGKTSSNAGNKSSDGAGTSSSSNGKKPNQTPSSSKKSSSSGETDATASSPGIGKKSGDGEGTNSPSSGKKTGQTPSTSKKSKSSGETDSTGSSSGTGKKPGDDEETGSSSGGKIEDPTPNTSKKTQTTGEADTTGSNTGTGKKSSEGEGTSSSSANKKDNQTPNSHNQWKQDSSKKKGKGKDDKKKKEEEKSKREEEERQKSESEAEGTGKDTKRYGDPPEEEFKFKIEIAAEKKAEEIRSTGLKDIEDFAKNTGLELQDAIDLKSHLFLNKYDLPAYDEKGLYFYKTRLTPDPEVIYAYHKVLDGELTPDQKKWFQQLKAHELDEKARMDSGEEYYRHPGSWDFESKTWKSKPPGAHDNAVPQPEFGTFPGYK
ncbi:hypothetical protein [Paenibacillus sp. FSL H8-0283]|uniref:hypothetical protein n=1 Tax=Paenibacillus sp. FSL H8-0283 TaxID=2921383 RepID=UPI00324BB891